MGGVQNGQNIDYVILEWSLIEMALIVFSLISLKSFVPNFFKRGIVLITHALNYYNSAAIYLGGHSNIT